jgi:DNA segregation ATPase FtsK/SpoIIIE, S-DNA-T family
MRLSLDLDDGTGASRQLAVDVDESASVGDVAIELASGLRLFDLKAPSLEVVGRPNQALFTDTPIGVADLRTGDRVRVVSGRAGGSELEVGASTLVIEAGPEAGRRLELGPGRHYGGRGGRSTLVIDDPLLSRVHFSVRVGDTIEVADEGSTNGVKVDGLVIGSPVTLRAGQRVAIGDTVFRVDQHAGGLATAANGTVRFNRPPRVWRPFVGSEVELPTPIGPKPKQRLPMISAAGPLVMGGAMFAITRNPQSMLFVMLSPLMMFGSFFESRRSGAQNHAEEVKRFRNELAETDTTLAKLAEDERTSREVEAPGVGALAELVEQTQARLWERSPSDEDFLDLRIGVDELPLRTKVKAPNLSRAMPELAAEAAAVGTKFAELRSAPVVVKLTAVGSIGVAGSQVETESLTRSVMLQLAALQSPADVVFAALLGQRMQERWEWMMWLPHVQSAASPISVNHLPATVEESHALLEAIAQLTEKRKAGSTYGSKTSVDVPAVVLFIDESLPIEPSRLSWLFQLDPNLGVFIVWLGSAVARLPKGCGAVVDIPGGGQPGTAGWTHTGERLSSVRFEGVPAEHAQRVARKLAPIVDVSAGAAGGAALPMSVSLIDVLEKRDLLNNPAPMTFNWKQSRSLGARVGRTGSGVFSIDMRLDGPHALVAGTTGAGKSELLQTLIASLAATHPPDRVTFLLVDYKGGSAFAKCVEFPHTVGLVTDLDTNQVRRALVSLNAELHYREKVLEKFRCKDLIELEKKHPQDAPPSLLLIVDEFAALAKEIPEFVDGVVNVAQRGRSLGLHLILATQRPAGVITDNIRANTNLSIALRVAQPSESSDVLGNPIAASISRTTPGRGVAKVGPQELVSFQTGYVGGHSQVDVIEASVLVADIGFGTFRPWPRRKTEHAFWPNDPTDLARLVDVANLAHQQSGSPLPRRPWMAPLGRAVNLFELPRSASDAEVVIGLQDEPAKQTQEPAIWYPEKDGSLAIFGASGAGKSVALWAMAASVSSAVSNPPSQVYALDFAGRSMEVLSELPNVGSVIASDDHERLTRLLTMLRATISQRAEDFAAVRASSLSSYRQLAPQVGSRTPRIFVFIDGYGNFLSSYERIERGVWADLVPKLIAEGRQVGVHFVITADRRGSIPNSTYSLIPQRIVLRLANEDEYGSVGAPYKVLNNDSPDGRAVFDGLETQIAVAGGSERADEQAAALRKLGAQLLRQRPESAAPAISVLPVEVQRVSIAATKPGVIGISGGDLGPVHFRLDEGVFVIAGPMKSGKTSALMACAEAAAEVYPNRQRFFCTTRRNAAAQHPGWDAASTTAEATAELLKGLISDLRSVPSSVPPFIFFDDFHEFHEGETGDLVKELLKLMRDVSISMVFTSESSLARRASQYTTLGEVKQFKHGLLLAPDVSNGDGDIIGVQLPATSMRQWPAGRGYIGRSGNAELIQVGLSS